MHMEKGNDQNDLQSPSNRRWFWGSRRLWVQAVTIMVITAALSFAVTSMLTSKLDAKNVNQLEQNLQKNVRLPEGYDISLFANGMKSPRLMVETETGDIIVSSYSSEVYLVSGDKDGRADKTSVLLRGLNLPHGLLLNDGWLYVAEQHQVSRIRFDPQKGTVSGKPETVLSGLPNNGGHSSRTLKKGPDGWFYLTIGSSCNVCRESHHWRATMLRFHPDKKAPPQIHASGLRNTVGFDWQPKTGQLYGVENGRDWLGDNFPPDELNEIKAGGFYGWPWRHGNNIPDPDLGRSFTGDALKPAFSFEAHIAPLSIRFLRHQKPASMQNTALVAQHGSWNRSTKNGYRIVSLHFGKDNAISRKIFLNGFLQGQKVIGRPVDIIERQNGNLLISDDYNGAIWRVRYTERH